MSVPSYRRPRTCARPRIVCGSVGRIIGPPPSPSDMPAYLFHARLIFRGSMAFRLGCRAWIRTLRRSTDRARLCCLAVSRRDETASQRQHPVSRLPFLDIYYPLIIRVNRSSAIRSASLRTLQRSKLRPAADLERLVFPVDQRSRASRYTRSRWLKRDTIPSAIIVSRSILEQQLSG